MLSKTLFIAGAATVAGFATLPHSVTSEVNPCQDSPINAQLSNVPCEDASVQSGANVTKGAVGLLAAEIDPIPLPLNDHACVVNVHWHLGTEHFSAGEYDQAPTSTAAGRRKLAGQVDPGYTCAHDSNDAMYTTPYEWKYCVNMHVGETYEIHWPHSNLGECGTKWQMQYPFIDGVLCAATKGNLTVQQAVDSVFTGQTTKIGVMGQVFTIVNPDSANLAYDYPGWNMLGSWNTDLAQDIAIYQGSTTGQTANNNECRWTGGMVTWHVDRECHKISAKSFDNLCKQMLEQADDMSPDVEPHGSRILVDPKYVTDVPMSRK